MRCFIFIFLCAWAFGDSTILCLSDKNTAESSFLENDVHIHRTFHMTESSDSSSLVEDCDVNGATNSWESLPPKVKKEKFIVLSDNKWACSSLVVEGFRGWRNRKRGTAAMQASHTSTGWCLIRLCCLSKGTVEENTRAPGASASTAPRLEFHLLNVLLFTVLSRSPSLISTCFFFFAPDRCHVPPVTKRKERERTERWRWEGTRNARAERRGGWRQLSHLICSKIQKHAMWKHIHIVVCEPLEEQKCWGEQKEKTERWNARCTFFTRRCLFDCDPHLSLGMNTNEQKSRLESSARLICLRPSAAFVAALKCKFDEASHKTRYVYTCRKKLQQHEMSKKNAS